MMVMVMAMTVIMFVMVIIMLKFFIQINRLAQIGPPLSNSLQRLLGKQYKLKNIHHPLLMIIIERQFEDNNLNQLKRLQSSERALHRGLLNQITHLGLLHALLEVDPQPLQNDLLPG